MVGRDNLVKQFCHRIRILVTGTVEWVDADGGVEVEHMPLRTRWSIFGVHSYNWKWVRRFGLQECGCTLHPVTRRKLLMRMDCPIHSNLKHFLLADETPVEPWHGHAKGSG